jgi:uncharacterized cofD-like protein
MSENKIKVVAFGGGTGLSQLLKGLKTIEAFSITAVVTMADDGGSSGRLRKSMGIPPPGDLRNCLVSLSNLEPLFKDVLQYRFQESELEGHSFGNLFLAVLTRLTGDFPEAINEAHRLLQVKGRVLPSILNKATLEALHEDGTKTTGQARITKTDHHIESIRLLPKPIANPEVIKAVKAADMILFGPGSLYTSVLVNLVPEKILDSVVKSTAQKVYICNPMTQPGETNGFSVEEHVRAFDEICHKRIINTLIVNNGQISPAVLEKYRLTGSVPVEVLNMKRLRQEYKVICTDLIEVDQAIRHDAIKLAGILLEIVKDGS